MHELWKNIYIIDFVLSRNLYFPLFREEYSRFSARKLNSMHISDMLKLFGNYAMYSDQ